MKVISIHITRQVLQQCKSKRPIHAMLSHRALRFSTGVGEKYENAVFETAATSTSAGGFNRRAGCDMMVLLGDQTSPMREEAM
jgi:hypothetical protein